MARHETQPGTTGETPVQFEQHEVAGVNERLKDNRERQLDQSKEMSPESARKEALSEAESAEREKRTGEKVPQETKVDKHRPLGAKHKDASFQRTMSTVQDQLSTPSRAFSKVIHNKAVERASDTIGATIARPNAILAGSIFAFFCTLAVYLIAKRYGYALSGFESIATFIIGWCLGLLFDFFKVMITGKRS